MNRIVIFDGNHLAYRAYYKFGNLKTIDGERTGVIYGMPYVAESLIRKLGPDKVAVVFDGGRHKSRIKILPEYKRRDPKLGFDRDDFYRQKDIGLEIFKALGLRVAWKKGFEADDIIAQITRRYYSKGWEVVIVSADKDFHQLLRPFNENEDGGGPVMMYNVSKGKMIDEYTLRLIYKYKPNQCVDFLCLTGDKSDNISGYPGIGEKRALKFLDEFGSIKNFLKDDGLIFGKMDKQKLKKVYRRNRKLIDLKYFYRNYLIKESIHWVNLGLFDEVNLREICNKYEINTFLKSQFINTFKNLQSE